MEQKLRVASGALTIEVNDAGESIRLPVSDDAFQVQFYRLLHETARQTEALAPPEDGDTERQLQAAERLVELERSVRERIDALFGPETCRKVFGETLPSMDAFADFFRQLLPFFEEHMRQRAARMRKYNAERAGSSL